MNILRLENKVPQVYPEQSRDFQLLCRLYTCIVDGIKCDIDSIININNANLIKYELLDLLATKVGFFTDYTLSEKSLRLIVSAWPYIIKYKGSKKGILQAILVYLKINNIQSTSEIQILINKDEYKIEITLPIEKQLLDIKILDTMLKYLIPTGFIITYNFEKRMGSNSISDNTSSYYENIKSIELLDNNINSQLRYDMNLYTNRYAEQYNDITVPATNNHLLGAIDTIRIIGNRELTNNQEFKENWEGNSID